MKTINIKNKLEEMGVSLDDIMMGDFDTIGEFTAKRQRSFDDPNYRKYGSYYRANYERGILIYYLIRQFNVKSVLEIGFGRGYASMCAAKAFYDSGTPGKIVSIDPSPDENLLKMLTQALPQEWFQTLHLLKGTSAQILPHIPSDERFDLVYIDGDHSYEGTKLDWEGTKDKFDKFLLFDDYHMPSKDDSGIQCSKLIDEIDDPSKELIIMDRRMFFDDRRFTDEQINYGQVLFTKPGIVNNEW